MFDPPWRHVFSFRARWLNAARWPRAVRSHLFSQDNQPSRSHLCRVSSIVKKVRGLYISVRHASVQLPQSSGNGNYGSDDLLNSLAPKISFEGSGNRHDLPGNFRGEIQRKRESRTGKIPTISALDLTALTSSLNRR